MPDLNQLFDSFTSQDSLFILMVTIISFLLGLLVGALSRGRKISALRKELRDKNRQLAEAQAEAEQWRAQVDLKEAALKKSAYDMSEVQVQYDRLSIENNKVNTALADANRRLNDQLNTEGEYQQTIDSLNQQLAELQLEIDNQPDPEPLVDMTAFHEELDELRRENEQLRQQLTDSSAADASAEVQVLQDRLAALQADNDRLRRVLTEKGGDAGDYGPLGVENDYAAFHAITRERLASLEVKLNRLEYENDQLRSVAGWPYGTKPAAQARMASNEKLDADGPALGDGSDLNFLEAETTQPEPEYTIVTEKDVLRRDIIELEDQKDDLTAIEGLGSYNARKLNELGILRYDQIALWDQETVRRITDELDYIPGRIEKDDWVGQARRLSEAHPRTSPKVGFVDMPTPAAIPGPEVANLKIVEGIGPKIEQLLKSNGVNNLIELAEADIDQLKNILQEAGSRFKMHDPTTWPNQARLAANGQWELLEEYQEELKGGREV